MKKNFADEPNLQNLTDEIEDVILAVKAWKMGWGRCKNKFERIIRVNWTKLKIQNKWTTEGNSPKKIRKRRGLWSGIAGRVAGENRHQNNFPSERLLDANTPAPLNMERQGSLSLPRPGSVRANRLSPAALPVRRGGLRPPIPPAAALPRAHSFSTLPTGARAQRLRDRLANLAPLQPNVNINRQLRDRRANPLAPPQPSANRQLSRAHSFSQLRTGASGRRLRDRLANSRAPLQPNAQDINRQLRERRANSPAPPQPGANVPPLDLRRTGSL